MFDYNGPGEETAHAVAGTIQVAGSPLAKGTVRFMPASGSMSSGSGAFIKNGEYEIPLEDGLIAGRYQVHISSISVDEQIRAAREGGSEAAKLQESVPARFNRESEIFVEVTPDGSILGFDFDLK
ncbi:MAG: hypothetical protein P4L85_00740 [Paludisphaera borealis]|uniref:hypothetical protein n=1 Tax=Paludisphaera borealis TaxID=1387353 RepID=UPI00283DF832|nr:hypothetical protein [Paludisphaera borealis]MDR3617847.1 hypothetical protein [Paludisphaera borealis]